MLNFLEPLCLSISLSQMLAMFLWRWLAITVVNVEDDPLLVRKLDVALGGPGRLAVDTTRKVGLDLGDVGVSGVVVERDQIYLSDTYQEKTNDDGTYLWLGGCAVEALWCGLI